MQAAYTLYRSQQQHTERLSWNSGQDLYDKECQAEEEEDRPDSQEDEVPVDDVIHRIGGI